MAYRDFKERDLRQKFGIQKREAALFKGEFIAPVPPSERLAFALEDARLITLSSEKAVSERIISNVIAELKRMMPEAVQIFSGEQINGDTEAGLNGEIDYVVTLNAMSIAPEAPILCVCESKIGRLDRAIPQAMAQLLGAERFNQKHSGDGPPITVLYGVVTDGNLWQFLRLEQNIVTVDTQLYYLNDLPTLLGAFKHILSVYFGQKPAT